MNTNVGVIKLSTSKASLIKTTLKQDKQSYESLGVIKSGHTFDSEMYQESIALSLKIN